MSIAILASALLFPACSREEPEVLAKPETEEVVSPTGPSLEAEEAEGKAPQAQAEEQENPLEDGSHSVYGLKLPRGMMPMKTPGDRHRFEGTHSLTVLRRYLLNQLDLSEEVVKGERDEALIRRAKVKGITGTGELLALRIYNGSVGGAGVEVWEDSPLPRATQASSAPGGGPMGASTLASSRSKNKDVPHYDKPANSYERKRRTFDLMERMAKGEKPKDSEIFDQYFY